jgi:hypothetical protein
VVIWLVGRTIQDLALERVRLWRRAGVDARVLRLEVRLTERGWGLRCLREDAPFRDRIEERLFGLADQNVERGDAPELRCRFYDETSASAAKSKGGRLLDDPIAWTAVGGEEVTVTASDQGV